MNFFKDLLYPVQQQQQPIKKEQKQFQKLASQLKACKFSEKALKFKNEMKISFKANKKICKQYYDQYFKKCQNITLTSTLQNFEAFPTKITGFIKQNKITQNQEFKLQYILPYNLHLRIIGLGFSSLLIGIVSYRSNKKLFLMLKNGVIAYYGIGMILTPEIFLPKEIVE